MATREDAREGGNSMVFTRDRRTSHCCRARMPGWSRRCFGQQSTEPIGWVDHEKIASMLVLRFTEAGGDALIALFLSRSCYTLYKERPKRRRPF
jgi:hypothetical protein